MTFAIGFSVEVDPEFPGDGGEPPERIPVDLPRIRAVLRVTPRDGASWDVAVGTSGWWRTPIPSAIAVLSDGDAYLLDTVQRGVLSRVSGVLRIREDELHDQLLLTTPTDLIAFGADGIRWRNDLLGRADLKVDAVLRDRIVLSDYAPAAERRELAVDPVSGRSLRGRR